MKQRCLDDFSQLLNLFFATTDVRVRNVWFIFNLHHSNRRIDLRRQWNMNLILVAVNSDTHSFFDICRCNWVGEIDDEFCKLLHVDDVFGIISIGIDDLCATCDLQRLFILKSLLISCEIPKCWWSQTSVAFLDSSQLVNLLNCLLDIILDGFNALVVLALTISLKQFNVSFIEIWNSRNKTEWNEDDLTEILFQLSLPFISASSFSFSPTLILRISSPKWSGILN